MTTDEQSPITTGGVPGMPLTFGGVCGKTWALYRTQGWLLTRDLLLPVGKMTLGLYSSLCLSLLFTQWITQPTYIEFATSYPVLVLFVVLGICGLGLFLFVQGAWQYFVYWASLCQNVQEALEGRPLDIQAAYAQVVEPPNKKAFYGRWLAALCLLPALPLVPAIGLPGLILLIPNAPGWTGPLLLIFGLLLGGILGVVWLVVQFLLSYGFQVVAFEEGVQSLRPIFWRSAKLTWRRPWLTFSLQVVLFILTNYVLTVPAAFLLRFSRLVLPLDDLHVWVSGVLIESVQAMALPSIVGSVISEIQANKLLVAQGVTDSVLSMTLSMLLLPLGTIAFTLVYLGLRQQEKPAAGMPTDSVPAPEA